MGIQTGIVIMVVTYMLAILALGVLMGRRTTGAAGYMLAGRRLGPVVVGALLVSEFVGLGTTVGTAELAFEQGIAAAWNVLTIGLGLILLAFVMAKKYREHEDDTISGVIGRQYGHGARLMTSGIMIYALLVVNVAMYVGGGSTIVPLVGVSQELAAVTVGLVTVVYLAVGGMFAVAYTSLIDVVFIIVGLVLAVGVGLSQVDGFSGLRAELDPSMFSLTSIDPSLLLAWTLANVGAVFSTQFVIQALASTSSPIVARRASIVAGLLLIPVAFLASLVGIAAAVVFPDTEPAAAFGTIAVNSHPVVGGLIVAGMGAALLGTVGGLTHAATALVMRDFYPMVKKDPSDRERLGVARVSNVVLGLIPIPFVLLVPAILDTVFFARGMRATLAVVAVMVFYLPGFSTPRGAVIGIGSAVVGATGWVIAGEPFGVDNIYIAVLAPLVVMGVDHVISRTRRSPTHSNVDR